MQLSWVDKLCGIPCAFAMVCHNDQTRHICEEKGVGVNKTICLFHPTMNILAMGTKTQGDVACSMLMGTI